MDPLSPEHLVLFSHGFSREHLYKDPPMYRAGRYKEMLVSLNLTTRLLKEWTLRIWGFLWNLMLGDGSGTIQKSNSSP